MPLILTGAMTEFSAQKAPKTRKKQHFRAFYERQFTLISMHELK
ncbi:MAG: hypothetical protein WA405_09825 [Candidatus Acidiferrales bacterium]